VSTVSRKIVPVDIRVHKNRPPVCLSIVVNTFNLAMSALGDPRLVNATPHDCDVSIRFTSKSFGDDQCRGRPGRQL
jgi:hypothetical protein